MLWIQCTYGYIETILPDQCHIASSSSVFDVANNLVYIIVLCLLIATFSNFIHHVYRAI